MSQAPEPNNDQYPAVFQAGTFIEVAKYAKSAKNGEASRTESGSSDVDSKYISEVHVAVVNLTGHDLVLDTSKCGFASQ
jgi:hypothetical protein